MELVTLTENEFMKFSKNSKITSFFQTTHWGEIKKDNGWTPHLVGLKDGKKLVAASLLLAKKIKFFKTMFYAPRGFLIDYDNLELVEEFTIKLKEYLKENDGLFLKINPYVDYQLRNTDGEIIENTQKDDLIKKLKSLGYVHNGFYIDQDKKKDLEPRWISVLDIKDKTLDEIHKNMRSRTKRHINNSKNNCIKIIEADIPDLVEFKKLMQHTAERREFVDRPLSYYENMYKVLNEHNLVKVLLAEINFKELKEVSKNDLIKNQEKTDKLKEKSNKSGQLKELELEKTRLEERIKILDETIDKYGEKKIISAAWYMLFGNEVNFLFGANYREFMTYKAQYILQDEMIKYAIENGYEKFNFYGIDGNFTEGSKSYGLFDFKRGFNACVHELIGEFDLVISKPTYNLYKFSFASYKLLKKIIKR